MRHFLSVAIAKLLPIFVIAFVGSAFAQSKVPSGLQPVPEPPPPPVGFDAALDAPSITIVQRGKDKVEEYRLNGKLYRIKVTPPHGVPYYLVDERGDGKWARQESTDTGVRVPMWVIGTF